MSGLVLDPGLIPRYLLLNIFLLLLTVFVIYKILKQFLASSERQLANCFYNILNNGFVYAYLGYILVSFISLKYSINQADGIFDIYKIVLGFIFVVLLSTVHSPQSTEKYNTFVEEVVKSLGMLNVVISFIGLFQLLHIFSTGEITHQAMHAMNGTFIHKNIFAEMLLITMPFDVYLLLKYKGFWKYAAATGATISIMLVIFSLTRAAWIAAIAASFATFILWLLVYLYKADSSDDNIKVANDEIENNSKKRNGKRILYIIIGVIIAATMLVFSEMDHENSLGKQISSITNFGYGSTKDRIILWENTIKIFKENPLTGDGLGSWKIDVLKYGNKGLKSEDNITFYTRPHNDYLWVLAETGIVGFIFFIGIWVFCLGYVVKKVGSPKSEDGSRKMEDSSRQSNLSGWQEDNTLYYVLFFVLVSYMTLSFFSFPRERIEHTVIMGIVMSIILLKKFEIQSLKFKVNNSSNKILHFIINLSLLIIIGLVLIGALKVGINRGIAEMRIREAYIERAKGNWNRVIEKIGKVDNKYYRLDPVCTPLSWYGGEAEYNLGNTENALIDFKKAYYINPYHIHVLNNLGTCYEIKGEHLKAIYFYEKAIKLSPHFEDALLNLAAVNFNTGNNINALSAIRNINLKTENKKYKPYLFSILKQCITDINDTITNPAMHKELINVSRQDAWMFEIFSKSIKNKITFERQLFLDAIFSLEKIDKRITFAESETLKKEYLKKNK